MLMTERDSKNSETPRHVKRQKEGLQDRETAMRTAKERGSVLGSKFCEK